MRIVKIFGIIFTLGALVFSAFGCKVSAATSVTTIRTATVTKGTLTNSITGTGNLAYSTTEDLKFELHSFVDEILVSEGDTVKKDQKLVTLDTTAWDTQIETLTKTLANAQRTLTTKQRTLATRQRTLATKEDTLAARQIALATAQRAITDKEFAVNQAQSDIDTATFNLSDITEVKEAQDIVDNAQLAIDIAKANMKLSSVTGDTNWLSRITELQTELDTANMHLQSVLNLTESTLKTATVMDIAKAQLALQQKQKALQDSKQAIEDAKNNVDTAQLNINYAQEDINEAQLDINDAQLDITDAQKDVSDAQTNLDEAKAISPIIVAPFDGYIIKIPVTGGQEVQKGTIGAIIADPNKFEANILVTENDINTIKLNGEATVLLDALELTFPAKITWIAPTASVNSGVVNYKIIITLTSLTPISNAVPGNKPAGTAPQTQLLKEGLSATVNIISEQNIGILYVPSKAVVRQGSNMIVKVANGTTIESRTVKAGMSDGTNTEIMEGLKEGETVNYNVTTSTASSSSQSGIQLGGGSGGGVPGDGGGPPGGGGPPQ